MKDVGNRLRIDGSYGEGGGQVLRTALALSVALRRPVEVTNIRKARPKPGLQPQHLTAVIAASAICGASVNGAALSSTGLAFTPGDVQGGNYTFDVSDIKGSAGSTSLVFQTILLPLFFAELPSTLVLLGGTHVPWSPTFHYLKQVFLPALFSLNADADINIEQWGWYPRGGGRVRASIRPCRKLNGLLLRDRGELKRLSGVSAVSNLPSGIAERQRARAVKVLSKLAINAAIETAEAPSSGKGTLLFLLAEFGNCRAGFDSLGAVGKRAETVADEACSRMLHYLGTGGALDPYLADQLVPYLALAHERSEFTTSRVTRHLLTNIWVVRQFLDRKIEVEGNEGAEGKITISGWN